MHNISPWCARVTAILTPWRLKWYPRGVLIAVAITFVLIMAGGSGPMTRDGFIGGDYRAFYVAGKIVANGEIDQLYSPSLQNGYQKALVPDQRIVLPFAYPPHFALIYAPLSQLPYRLSYAIHSLAMIAALALACLFIQRMYPTLIKNADLLFFIALTAHPIFRSVFGGQNTALSILLIVLCWYKVLHNRHYQAGIFLGLLFFKPQYALPLAGLFLLSGRWRVWATAGATTLVLIGTGTALAGPGWIFDWLDLTEDFHPTWIRYWFPYIVSWTATGAAIFGTDTGLATGFGWGAMVATVAIISWVWYAGGRKADIGAHIGLASICILLLAPQTSYYDTGIALIAVVVLLNWRGRADPLPIALVWAASHLQVWSESVGFSLLAPPLLLILTFALIYLWRPATQDMVNANAPIPNTGTGAQQKPI